MMKEIEITATPQPDGTFKFKIDLSSFSEPVKKTQVNLKEFREMFGIPQETVKKYIHSKGFPAFKQCGKWYVDLKKYEKWRETEHRNEYAYAD